MMKRSRMRPDWGLRLRMIVTGALLVGLYIGFLSFLSAQGVGIGPLIAIAAVMLGIQYFFSDKLALRAMRAKAVSPEEAPELHAMVDRLAAQAGVPKPKVALSPMEIPNAFATGRNPRKAAVAVTQGLMDRLPPREVEAVLAHEVAHVAHRDVAVMTLASFFAMIAFFVMRWFMFMGLFGGGRGRGGNGGGAAPILVILLVSMAVYFISQILIMALSRYRELKADRRAAYLTGRPSDLASALRRISGEMRRVPKQGSRQIETMNAFFIIPTSFKDLFSSHPKLERRIAQLEDLAVELEGR